MALPLSAAPAALTAPPARPLSVTYRITAPPAAESDSYLGGFASGLRFTYLDAMHFVWWTPGSMPAAYGDDGYGSGPYGGG